MLYFVYREGQSNHCAVSPLEHQDSPFYESAAESGLLMCDANIVPYYCKAPSLVFPLDACSPFLAVACLLSS